MQAIFDELTKNGVEFIEPSDPRAKLADYSVCFMYPNIITQVNVSRDTTLRELVPFEMSPGHKLRFENTLKHLDPSAVRMKPEFKFDVNSTDNEGPHVIGKIEKEDDKE